MSLRVIGTSEDEGTPYYLREEFEVDQALTDGFTIYRGSDGYYYGNRPQSGGWTARDSSQPTEQATPDLGTTEPKAKD